MRMTRQRRRILNLLEASERPKSAEMIHQELAGESLDLSTVYRTLDTFFEEGLISKSSLKNTSYYYLRRKDHRHYMICLSCHKMIEIDCHISDIESEIAADHHFDISHHDMTIYGYCQDCQ